MDENVTIEYWEDSTCFVGRIVEYPDIVAFGKTLEELEENLRKAYLEEMAPKRPGSKKKSNPRI